MARFSIIYSSILQYTVFKDLLTLSVVSLILSTLMVGTGWTPYFWGSASCPKHDRFLRNEDVTESGRGRHESQDFGPFLRSWVTSNSATCHSLPVWPWLDPVFSGLTSLLSHESGAAVGEGGAGYTVLALNYFSSLHYSQRTSWK